MSAETRAADDGLIRLCARWTDLDRSFKGTDVSGGQANHSERKRLLRKIATTPAHSVCGALAKLRVADEIESYSVKAWDWGAGGPAQKMIASAIGDLGRLVQRAN